MTALGSRRLWALAIALVAITAGGARAQDGGSGDPAVNIAGGIDGGVADGGLDAALDAMVTAVGSDAGVLAVGDAGALEIADAGSDAAVAPVTPPPAPVTPLPESAPVARESATPTAPSYVPVPVPSIGTDFVDTLFPVLPQAGPWTTFGLLIVLAGAFLLSATVRRMRDSLPEEGILPRALDFFLAFLRIVMLLLVVGIVARLVPASLGPVLSWALLAAAAAIGWSARDVLPDLLAGLLLFFERRVRRGIWVTVSGHAGIVESRGPRAVLLRDGLGHRIAVPNRLFLTGAVVSQPGGAFHDVSLRFAVPGVPAARLRRALHDAVLTSPWVQPDADGIVRRDGTDPSVWHVRARLIDVRFAVSFEGELLERAEEMLAAARAGDEEEDWD